MLRKLQWAGIFVAGLLAGACGGGSETAVVPKAAVSAAKMRNAPGRVVSNGELFTWAQAAYPQFFPGTPQAGRYQQYDFRLYESGNYLAVDDADEVCVLGPVSGGQVLCVGSKSDFSAQVLAWQAAQPFDSVRGQVLISVYKADGAEGTIQDFVDFTHYTINRWSMYSNYGMFAQGRPQAGPQMGSDISVKNVAGVNYIAMDVPKNQPFYFTALWKAPTIGTVFMRTDAQGAGHTFSGNEPLKLELPYHFARDEFSLAQRLASGITLSAQAQALMAQATDAMNTANQAGSASARAVASYTALSYVMPLKERLVLDASNSAITSRRPDFDLNFEGFGSWTDTRFAATYAAAKEAGFKSVYTAVEWKRVSTAPGVYDFSYLDYLVQQARAQGFKVGININQYLSSKPDWAQGLDFEALKTLYYEHARMVVARYGDQISQYYPAGELELQMGNLTREQVAELARQSLAGARAAAPNTQFGYYVSACQYVAYQMNPVNPASFMCGQDLLAYMVKSGIRHDFVGLEMQYGTTFAPIDLQRFKEVVEETYRVVQVPIYMGETGYSSMGQDYGMANAFYWHEGHTRQAQYEWADGTLRILYAMPYVKGYFWVHLDPENNDYGSDYLTTLIGTSFVTAGGEVKKVQSAFKDFNTMLQGLPAAAAARR